MATKKSMKKSAKSPVRRGRMAVSVNGGFLKLGDGENITVAFLHGLDDMLSAEIHSFWDLSEPVSFPCVGETFCPGCAMGNTPRLRGYVSVLPKGEETPIVWAFTQSVYAQIEALEDSLIEEGETLVGFTVRVTRKGSGLKTKYSVVGLGKRVDVDDVEPIDLISKINVVSADEALEQLIKAGAVLEPSDDEEGDDW